MRRLKQILKTFLTGRNTFYRDCSCGKYEKCTIKYYSTSRGGLGIEEGLMSCGKVQQQIKDFNKMIDSIEEQ